MNTRPIAAIIFVGLITALPDLAASDALKSALDALNQAESSMPSEQSAPPTEEADQDSQSGNESVESAPSQPPSSEELSGHPVKTYVLETLAAVQNGPTASSTYDFDTDVLLIKLSTYHWNGGRGSNPGTIGLIDQNGVLYGPWRVAGRASHDGHPNVYWDTLPNAPLPAGSYTILDSDGATWSMNSETNGRGVFWITWQETP